VQGKTSGKSLGHVFTKGKLVNKSQLIDTLAARFEGNRKAASHALESVLDTITREVAKGEKVAITGFGSFEKKVRDARWVRNPSTGQRMKAKKKAVPNFKAGAQLKDVVSGAKKLPKLTLAAVDKATPAAARPAVQKTAAAAKKATTRSAPAKKTTSTAKKAPAKTTSTAKKASGSTAKKASTAKKSSTSTAKKAPAKTTSTAKKTTSTAKKSPAAKKTTSTAKKAPAKTTSTAKKTTAKKTGAAKETAKKA
jgi:DNA-binding protein HU-beta